MGTYADPALILPGTVGSTELATGAVTAAKIADDAVETAKIKDANVTVAKVEAQLRKTSFFFRGGAFDGAVVQGTWIFDSNATATSGTMLQSPGGFMNSSASQNDSYSWGPLVFPPGDYDLILIHRKSNNFGKIHLLIDGVDQGNIDTYAASSSFNEVGTISFSLSSATTGTLQLKVSDKNASSSAYVMYLQGVVLFRKN